MPDDGIRRPKHVALWDNINKTEELCLTDKFNLGLEQLQW
jgi:hypothetical protein